MNYRWPTDRGNTPHVGAFASHLSRKGVGPITLAKAKECGKAELISRRGLTRLDAERGMMNNCAHCQADVPASAWLGIDGNPLCQSCAESEVLAMLRDCDAEEIKTLRRRVEDCLRKHPATLLHIAAILAVQNRVRIDDLV